MTVPDKTERARLAQAAQQARADLVEQLQAMPAAMRDKPQWLLWRFIEKPGASKPAKVPFYASGELRGWPKGKPRDGKATDAQPQVDQGHELDRAALVPLADAIKAFKARAHWAGVGFAFLPGDGLIGVDIDGAIDAEHCEMSELCTKLMGLCGSYTELSPSGKGVHIILAGECDKFKDDAIGLEVYAGSQYFTCTGKRFRESPNEVMPADPLVLAYMRELVDESKARQAAAKEADRLAARAAAPAPAPRPAAPAGDAGGQNDFRLVNDQALASLDAWVPRVLPDAREWQNGYRITSKALGRNLQEDLKLTPDGIYDFGEEQAMSPVDVVLKWLPGMAAPKDALHWLAGQLGITLRRVPARAVPRPAPPSPPPHETGAAADQPVQDGPLGDEPPPADDEPSNVVPLVGKGKRPRAPSRGKGDAQPDGAEGEGDDAAPAGKGKRKIPKEVWDQVDALCERFVLIYSTDHAWDRAERMLVKIPAMRLAFQKTPVNLWLTRPDRQMVRPADLVFEPGADVQAPLINMFGGLELQPLACDDKDVEPMLRLLRHLCSESQTPADDVDAIMHWVLCWQAVPLQQLGTKMQTAIVMHGAQGTGKNLYWDMWRDLFGEHGVTVGQTELEDKFNAWISRKMAILGDEVVSKQEMYHNKNRLKMVVTQQDKFPIRDIHQSTRWESNHANVVFLSNESQPLALEERDRRFLVVYTPLEADTELYEQVRDFKRNDGLRKWLYYLQNYPVGDFEAHTKPLMTQAKEDLIEAGWKPAVRFAHEWLGGYLDLPLRVCSAEQLYRVFKAWVAQTGTKWPPDQSAFTNEVKRWVGERVKRGPDGKLQAPALRYKSINLRLPDGADGAASPARRTVRCWLPGNTGAPDGVSEGAWAGEAVAAFEHEVYRFNRRSSVADGDEP